MFDRPVRLTRSVRVSCAQRCFREDLDDAQNLEVFGPTSRVHGHDYRIEVTLRGRPDPETGMLVDPRALDRLLHELIVAALDHRQLEEDVEEFQDHVPTAEAIAAWCFAQLEEPVKRLPAGVDGEPADAELFGVAVREHDALAAEVRAEER